MGMIPHYQDFLRWKERGRVCVQAWAGAMVKAGCFDAQAATALAEVVAPGSDAFSTCATFPTIDISAAAPATTAACSC